MGNEDRMAQMIAEKDHTIGVLVSIIEEYRTRLEETQDELAQAETMKRVWWEQYRDLRNKLEAGGDADE